VGRLTNCSGCGTWTKCWLHREEMLCEFCENSETERELEATKAKLARLVEAASEHCEGLVVMSCTCSHRADKLRAALKEVDGE
jgi:hypothetical protein